MFNFCSSTYRRPQISHGSLGEALGPWVECHVSMVLKPDFRDFLRLRVRQTSAVAARMFADESGSSIDCDL